MLKVLSKRMRHEYKAMYNWKTLHFFEFEVEVGIEAIEKLRIHQDKVIAELRNDFETKVEKDEFLKSLEDSRWGGYFSQQYDTDIKVIDEIERMQRYSLILYLYSWFEARLKSVCKSIEDFFGFKVKLSDLKKEEDLSSYKNYLTKVYELNFGSIDNSLNLIKQQKIVRNIIAHHDGIIPENDIKRIQELRGKIEIINLDLCQMIDVKSELMDYLLEKMTSFFQALFLSMDERYKAIKSQP